MIDQSLIACRHSGRAKLELTLPIAAAIAAIAFWLLRIVG
jgi:hypothetical protein